MKKNVLNFLIKLKNNKQVHKPIVTVEKSLTVINILKIFYSSGYILSFKVLPNLKIHVFLRFLNGKSSFDNVKFFFNKNNTYLKYSSLIRLTTNKKLIIISTSYGLKTLFECKKQKLGGKLYFIG